MKEKKKNFWERRIGSVYLFFCNCRRNNPSDPIINDYYTYLIFCRRQENKQKAWGKKNKSTSLQKCVQVDDRRLISVEFPSRIGFFLFLQLMGLFLSLSLFWITK